MSRLASLAKAGYYPTPDRVTQLITNYLGRPLIKDAQAASYGRLIDPCAGMGTAAHHVAVHLGIESFGIELDAERWFKAQEVLTKALHLDYNSARVTRDAFSLLYLNPPYDISDDKDSRRLEFEFLKDTSDWLAPGGVLVYIIPQPQFSPRVVRWLSSHYSNVRIYRFPDPEYAQFKQTVAFGVKKETITRDEDAETELNKILRIEFGVNSLPVLGAGTPKIYTIPAVDQNATFHFRSQEVSQQEALKAALEGGAWHSKQWSEWLSPHKAQPFKPLMPLKKGHLAMLIASGMMQNLLLESGDVRLVVKGRTYKKVKTTESVDGEEERAKDVFVTEIVYLNLNTGKITRLDDELALGEFIIRWQKVITEKVMNSYSPLYQFDYAQDAPVLNSLSLHRQLPGRAETGLFEAQKHISSAMATHFRNGNKSAILVGEMGCGKSTAASSIVAALGAKANPALILCPPHLTVKWLREIREIVPNAYAMELTHFSDVDKFFMAAALQPKGVQCFAVLSREKAKLGSGWRAAYRVKKVGHRDPFDDTFSTTHVIVCPRCGALATDEEGALVTRPDYFEKRKRFCTNLDKTTMRECGEPFWQATHFNGEEGNLASLGNGLIGKRKTRYPIADYIYRKYKGRFKFFIGDEIHELKNQSSDQGYAFGTLVRAAHRTLGLTGTLYGGYASSIFFILHRLFPKFRRAYGWRESQDFIARYGVLERVTKFDDGDNGYGHYSGRRRSKTYVRELPGISPELAVMLLDSTCFLSLQDLGFDLPPFQEYPNVIEMENRQQQEYDDLDDFMKKELHERMKNGDKSLLSAYLQSTLGYPNACFRVNDVTDKRGAVIYTAPMIADQIFPKEYELLKLVHREQKEGRRVIVFCRQTGTRDITEHLVSVLGSSQIRATVLPASVAANKREDWINKRVKEGMQVMITNPNLVKTGLDLIAFPTIVFFEMDYSIYTMQQAARRSWRLGQTDDVRVFYYVYGGTMEHRAMALVGSKWNAAEMLVGDSVAAALAQESDNGGSFLQELAKSVIQSAPVEDLQSMFRKRGVATRDDYIGIEKRPVPILTPKLVFINPVVLPPPTHGQQLSLF